MTDEEKKALEAKGGKPDAGAKPDDAGTAALDDVRKKLAATEEKLAEVTNEAIERRKENKELRALRDSLAAAFGGKEPAKVQEEVEQVRKSASERVARGIRHSAAVSALARAGAHDPEQVARLVDLGKIEVDEDAFAVKDADALAEKVDAFKKANAWAFKAEGAPSGDPKKPSGSPTKTPPAPKLDDGKTPFEAWRAAMDRKDLVEAAKLWREHPEIRKQVKVHA